MKRNRETGTGRQLVWHVLCAILLLVAFVCPQRVMADTTFYSHGSFTQTEDSPTKVGDFTYYFYQTYDVINGGTQGMAAIVVGYLGSETTVTIPKEVRFDESTFYVVGINWRFRDHYGNCQTLHIPNTVRVIDQGAFTDVDGIKELYFDDADDSGIGSHELYCHDSGSLYSTYGAFTYMDGLTYVYVGRDLLWKEDEYTQAPFYRNNSGLAFTVTVGPKVKELRYHLFHYAKVSHVYLDDAESLTSIGKYAFSVNSGMELGSITIPAKVTHIGEYAFEDGCVNEVTFKEGEETLALGDNAFSGCSIVKWSQSREISGDYQPCSGKGSLKEITIGRYVKNIRDNEFMNCTNVTKIDMSKARELQTIGEHAFEDCDETLEVSIPKSVNKIGYEAFYDMDKLLKVTFEDGGDGDLDMTGGFVFYGYNGYSKDLQEVYLGRTLVTKEGNENYEFADRNGITKVTIGPGCHSIPKKLFMNCYNVSTIDMSNALTLKTIGEQAFEDCDKVTELVIPKNVTKLCYEAFYDMDKLEKLTIEDSDETLDMTGGYVFYGYEGASRSLREVYLGRTLWLDEGKENYEFADRTSITKVTIGPKCPFIPKKLFMNCYSLSTIDLSGATTLNLISDHAFEDCDMVTELVIPASVTKLGYEAFYDMDALKKLTIEDCDEPIDMTGGYVFYGYNGYSKELQEVYLGRTLQMGDGYEDNEFAGRSNITKVTVGPHCKTVNKQLFMNCYNVNTIDFSNATSLLTIEQQAFEDCDKVTSLSIPACVQVIGYQAFYDMDELSTLTFEDSQTGLNLTEGQQFRMFRNENAKLKTVYLGRNVTISATASDRNFYNRGITDVTIGKYVTSIPDMLFYNNPFSTITFQQGEGPLSIGKQAFVGDGSTTLSSLVIPTPVQQIGEEAFYDNGNLQTLNIKFYNSALIEKNAFDNCSKITTVIVDLADGMHARQAADCFESSVYANAMLKCNAYDATVATTYEPWKSFTHKDTDYNTAVLSFFYNAKEYVLTLGDDGTYRYQNDNGELLTFPLVDAIPVNAPVDFVAKVSYDRTVTLDGTWAETLFLPFSMEIPEGMTVYTLCKPETALDEDQVMFEEAERIEAMQPYIITLDGGSYTFGTVESTIKAGHSTVTVFDNRNYELVGTIDGLDVMSQYIATGTKMQFSGQGVQVSPYRAALKYMGTGPTSVTAVLKPVDFDIIDDATTNAGQVAAAAGRLVNVTLKGRTFLKNQNWNTLCVPFNMTDAEIAESPLADAEIRELKEATITENTLTLTFSETNSISAGQPYLFRWSSTGESVEDPVFNNVTILNVTTGKKVGDMTFCGTYDALAVDADDRSMLYLGSGNKLYYPAADIIIGACRAYFKLPEGTTAGNLASGVSNFVLVFDDATGIDSVGTDHTAMGDDWYSLEGQRISGTPSKKGVYIYKGKKFIRK